MIPISVEAPTLHHGFLGLGATGERAACIGCELGDYFDSAAKRVLDAAERQTAFVRPKRAKRS